MFSPKPKILHIDGIAVPIDPDFRIMCEYSEALSEKDGEKACGLAGRFYFAGLPEGVSEAAAAEAMTDFYILGLAPKAKEKRSSVSESCEPCFDFSEDEAYFYPRLMKTMMHTVRLLPIWSRKIQMSLSSCEQMRERFSARALWRLFRQTGRSPSSLFSMMIMLTRRLRMLRRQIPLQAFPQTLRRLIQRLRTARRRRLRRAQALREVHLRGHIGSLISTENMLLLW